MDLKARIRNDILSMQDVPYRDFQSRLIPTVDPSNMVGVRTPQLRRYARDISKEKGISEFLDDVPHSLFEEDQLHAFIISDIRDFRTCLWRVDSFLPFVNNWATCDQMSPPSFKKNRAELLTHIDIWLESDSTYTVRFAVKMLMDHFLDDDYDISFPEKVAAVRSDEYYVKMMAAWYFATALAKQYDDAEKFLRDGKLDIWTHNMTIRKATESRRISDQQKAHLRTLKR